MRSGDTFTGYTSTDGADWLEVGSVLIPMPAEVYVGLAVTSRTNTALNTAVFDRVHVVTVRSPGGGTEAMAQSPARPDAASDIAALTQAAGSPSTSGVLPRFPDEAASPAADSGWEALARAAKAGQGQTPAHRDDEDGTLPRVRAVHTEDTSMEILSWVEPIGQAGSDTR